MDALSDGTYPELDEDDLDVLEQAALATRNGMPRWAYVKGIEDVPTGEYL